MILGKFHIITANGHVIVKDEHGRFVKSADTVSEARAEIESMREIEEEFHDISYTTGGVCEKFCTDIA